MKRFYFVTIFVIGLVVGYAIANFVPNLFKKNSTGLPQLTGRIVLYNQYPDGTKREAGVDVPYDISGIYPGTSSMWLSPDKSKVVYTDWEDARVVVYVANVDGAGVKKIAEQSAPEGSGELIVSSIRWSDESHISYIENGLKCEKESCINPSDFSEAKTTYSIDVNTGEHSIIGAK